MEQKTSSAELRIRIAKYRAMARLTTDRETAQLIHDLSDELEARLRAIQAPDGHSSRDPN